LMVSVVYAVTCIDVNNKIEANSVFIAVVPI
jgi:hypothetical protein